MDHAFPLLEEKQQGITAVYFCDCALNFAVDITRFNFSFLRSDDESGVFLVGDNCVFWEPLVQHIHADESDFVGKFLYVLFFPELLQSQEGGCGRMKRDVVDDVIVRGV
ncbi:hypothetical protein [Corynebacterium sp. sy039]|uniref:hypothetical protein n=1 Tax=Corynebacterium sp. sy039 TaxID=2599641 RepID=UPI0011B35DF8|nr:hypothetical protein [Corynebacterium sp. sy039]QDZ43299.1 hypothetical protein FQV43_09160 [Corynebacterium sp. sy039]